MKKVLRLAFVVALGAAVPAQGQDILAPIEAFVEGLVGPPAPPPARPQRPAPAPVSEPVVLSPDDAPPLPRERPEQVEASEVAPAVEAEAETPLPEPAEDAEVEAPSPDPAEDPPMDQPQRVFQGACPAVIMGLVVAEAVAPISEGACGERSPLSVSAVLVRGRMVPLSSPVVTNCEMASALPGWLETVDGYAGSMLDSPLASVVTGTSYMCRARVGTADDLPSEHGFANALDVVGFTLEDGTRINVEDGWMPAGEPAGRLLRLAHDAACGSFTTVLGPEANAAHEDHLHLDLGCHGASCTARLCE
jgi:hypothetical protein